MHIILSTDINFIREINAITSWELTFEPMGLKDNSLYPEYPEGLHREYDYFYIGSSNDKTKWVLAALPWNLNEKDESTSAVIKASHCSAILVDPPLVREESIRKILFNIFLEIRKNKYISTKRIDEILNSVPFNEYLPAQSYLPELPEIWRQLPAELCVDFMLSDDACLYESIWEEYSRDSLKDALKVVCGPRDDGLLIGYQLVVRDVIPFLAWDVDWPLSRRGKRPPYKREKVQGVFPWEYHADQTILSVYQEVQSRSLWTEVPYYGKPVVKLRVGGRNQQEAISNWHQCAKVLRPLKPSASEQ